MSDNGMEKSALPPQSGANRQKSSIILIMLAVLVLMIDVRITTNIAYPEYVLLDNYGTEIQKLVMWEVVGGYVRLDIISDTLGYLLLAAGALGMARHSRRFKKSVVFSAAGCALYIFRLFMPFLVSGAQLYGLEYAIHFVIAAAESLAVYYAVSGVVFMCETVDNHQNGVLIEIFISIACICSFIRGMGAFYRIMYVAWIYLTAQVLFTALSALLLYGGRRYYDGSRVEAKERRKE